MRSSMIAAIGALTALALAAPVSAQTYKNLPMVCIAGGAENGTIDTCTREKYDIPVVTDLVRHCQYKDRQCNVAELRLKRWGTLSGDEVVDTCQDPALPRGELDIGKCADWHQVPKSQTPELDYFRALPTSGPSPLTVLLQWKVAGVANCVASGGWGGNKGTQGEETIVATVTTTYTLACTGAGTTGGALISWVAPTSNTDGSALTNLAGFRILYGTSPTVLSQLIDVSEPARSSYQITSLTPGIWYFAMKAYNAVGAESVLTSVVSKDVAAELGKQWSHSIAVTIQGKPPAVPMPPTNLRVTDLVAHRDSGIVEQRFATR